MEENINKIDNINGISELNEEEKVQIIKNRINFIFRTFILIYKDDKRKKRLIEQLIIKVNRIDLLSIKDKEIIMGNLISHL